MPSRLATRLLGVPRAAGPVADVIWRQSDVTAVEAAGCAPSDSLLSELLFVLNGDPAAALGKILPDGDQLRSVLPTAGKDFQLGAASNPVLGEDDLQTLAASKFKDVAAAAQARLDARADLLARAGQAEVDAVVELLKALELDLLDTLVDSDPDLVVAALLRCPDRSGLLVRVYVLDKSLHDRMMLAWLQSDGAPLDAYCARWATATEVRVDTLLAPMDRGALRRRCFGGSLAVFGELGLVTLPTPPKGPVAPAPLEAMSMILGPQELAGLLVAAPTPVDPALAKRILLKAPESMLVNYLLGTTARRPAAGEVTDLVMSVDEERRSSWADAIAARQVDAELLASLPWAGELLLLASRDLVENLDTSAMVSVNATLVSRLGDVAASWELAMVLSEEWEGTLADLLDTAFAMESSPA